MFSILQINQEPSSREILKRFLQYKRIGQDVSADFDVVMTAGSHDKPRVQSDRKHIVDSVVAATQKAMIEFSNTLPANSAWGAASADFVPNQLISALSQVVLQQSAGLPFVLTAERLREFQWYLSKNLASFCVLITDDYYRTLLTDQNIAAQEQFKKLYSFLVPAIFGEFNVRTEYLVPTMGPAISVGGAGAAVVVAGAGVPADNNVGGRASSSWGWSGGWDRRAFIRYLAGFLYIGAIGTSAGITAWKTNESLDALLDFLAQAASYGADLPSKWDLFLQTHGRITYSTVNPNNEDNLETVGWRLAIFIMGSTLAAAILGAGVYKGCLALHACLQGRRRGFAPLHNVVSSGAPGSAGLPPATEQTPLLSAAANAGGRVSPQFQPLHSGGAAGDDDENV